MIDRPEDEVQSPAGAQSGVPYRVLARKYRPASFADLIGQEPVVRTLTNAITAGRIAHAYILTGVRGVGKTTTARILARALNCIGADGGGESKGAGGPKTVATAEPCGRCEHCLSIAEDRHVDVLEMDAASRTGIDDVRELIESVRYRPVSARYKIYIIDEVHMLSRQAFNGLLKTLEEPPENVIFIFATTEIRKVPVTVLSRCQRFDLRRVDEERLAAHFAAIAASEGIAATPAALALIARAADGSVRDGLSLLDQAIALAGGPVGEDHVKDMLGLADRTQVLDLFEAVMAGRIAEALDLFAAMYAAGADPQVVLQDLLELSHFLTRARLIPQVAEDPGVPEAERARGCALAGKLSMGALARAWQILLKGLGEARFAPVPLQAAEMVLVRLAHASSQPTPAELVRALSRPDGNPGPVAGPDGGPGPGRDALGASPPRATAPQPVAPQPVVPQPVVPQPVVPQPVVPQPVGPKPAGASEPSTATAAAAPETNPEISPEPAAAASPPEPGCFAEAVALARARKEGVLASHLERDVHLVRFAPGVIEFRPGERAPHDLAGRLGRLLQDATGRRWIIGISGEPGMPTLDEQRATERARRFEAAERDPLAREVLARFPGARIVEVRGAAETRPVPEDPVPEDPVPEDPVPEDPAPEDSAGLDTHGFDFEAGDERRDEI